MRERLKHALLDVLFYAGIRDHVQPLAVLVVLEHGSEGLGNVRIRLPARVRLKYEVRAVQLDEIVPVSAQVNELTRLLDSVVQLDVVLHFLVLVLVVRQKLGYVPDFSVHQVPACSVVKVVIFRARELPYYLVSDQLPEQHYLE